jgi:hypothetical protein
MLLLFLMCSSVLLVVMLISSLIYIAKNIQTEVKIHLVKKLNNVLNRGLPVLEYSSCLRAIGRLYQKQKRYWIDKNDLEQKSMLLNGSLNDEHHAISLLFCLVKYFTFCATTRYV